MLLKDIFANHLSIVKVTKRRSTYDDYLKKYKLLNSALDDLKILNYDDLNDTSYLRLIDHLKSTTTKKNSQINAVTQTLITALNIQELPIKFKQFKLENDTTHYRAIPEDEFNLFLNRILLEDLAYHQNMQVVTALMIMIDCGTRKSETLNILTQNIDLYEQTIFLVKTKTKQRKIKYGSLSKDMIEVLYQSRNKYLLTSNLADKPLHKSRVEKYLKELNEEFKFISGNVCCHRLRKTFATKLMKAGCPITSIQKILGHSDIKTTMVYLEVDNEVVTNDYDKFYPFK